MATRVYLDTSVLSALHDGRAPERQQQTASFWLRLKEFEVSTSELARQEIMDTPDGARRAKMLSSLAEISVFAVAEEMRSLALRYVEEGIFANTQESDALHVASAVLTRHEVLLSWNFKHLVNRRRRALVNAVHHSLGLVNVDIISPPEM